MQAGPNLHFIFADWVRLFGGQIVQLVISGASLILLARTLAPSEFGYWVAVTALTSTMVPLVGLGYGNLLIRETSRDNREFGPWWGAALMAFAVSSLVATIILIFAGKFVVPVNSLQLLPFIAVTDLVFKRFVVMASTACQARKDFRAINILGTINTTTTFAAILIWTASSSSVTTLAAVYGFTGLIMAVSVALWSFLRMPCPQFRIGLIGRSWRDAFYFLASPYSTSLRENAGAVTLSKLGLVTDLAYFGAASRLVTMALVPLGSLMIITYPEFFRLGHSGGEAVRRFLRRLAPIVFGGCAVLAIVLYLAAPLVPYIIGEKYQAVVPVVQVLVLLVPLRAVQLVFADALSGVRLQRLRVIMQALAALLCLGLNAVLVPHFGWRGAAASMVVTELVLAGLLAGCLVRTMLSARAENPNDM